MLEKGADTAAVHPRFLAREMVFKTLYAKSLSGECIFEKDEVKEGKYDKSYARKLMGLYNEHAPHIHAAVERFIHVESSTKASDIEKCICYTAAVELMFVPSTPVRVCLNEAVELARRYGGTGGYKLVNAALDALSKEVR